MGSGVDEAFVFDRDACDDIRLCRLRVDVEQHPIDEWSFDRLVECDGGRIEHGIVGLLEHGASDRREQLQRDHVDVIEQCDGEGELRVVVERAWHGFDSVVTSRQPCRVDDDRCEGSGSELSDTEQHCIDIVSVSDGCGLEPRIERDEQHGAGREEQQRGDSVDIVEQLAISEQCLSVIEISDGWSEHCFVVRDFELCQQL